MKHINHRQERSAVKKMLLIEESLSERVIGIFRTAIFSAGAALAVLQAVALRTLTWRLLLPLGVIGAAVVFLLVHALVAGKRAMRTGRYPEIMKYLHITADAALISGLAFAGLGVVQSLSAGLNTVTLAVLYTAFFMVLASVYFFINLFRFHPWAGLYAGLLLSLLFFVVPFFTPLLHPLLRNPALVGTDRFYLFFCGGLFVADVALSVLLAARVRCFLVRHKSQERLARFLPETLDREALERGQDIPEQGARLRATVLFAGLEGFNGLAAAMTPEETVGLLNSFHQDMTEVIFKYEGAIDKITGDGLSAVFGAPLASVEAEANAVRAAVDMIRKLEGLNALRKRQKKAAVKIGIGIHSGEAVFGSIGSERRRDFIAVGGAVDTAVRLEQFTRTAAGRIVVSETTRAKLGDEFSVKILGKVTLRGRTQALKVYVVNPWLTPVNMDETQA